MANAAETAEIPADKAGVESNENNVAPPAKNSAVGNIETILKDRYHIQTGSPLPHLDSPTAKAFQASDSRDSNHKVFALLCADGITPRGSALPFFKDETFVGVLQLVEYGSVFWPPVGRKCMVIIYRLPMGGRVFDYLASQPPLIRPQEVNRLYLEPMVHMLADLVQRGIPLRSIRADNLFFVDQAQTQVVVGDCVTIPAGYDQPVIYEPIERAMADRSGRGTGDFQCDLYAFGVTLAILVMGQDPSEGLSDIEIVTTKIEMGSYATLTRNANIPIALLEPLRGLLMDDLENRWGIDELELWLDGRRLTPMQKSTEKKADIGYRFDGGSYTNLRTLAWAFSRAPKKAIKEIGGEELVIWIRRSLGLKDLSAILAEVAKGQDLPGNKDIRDDMIVARVCILFDHDAPIRYKGHSFMTDGFASLLAIEYQKTGQAKALTEILVHELVIYWYGFYSTLAQLTQGERKIYTQLKSMLAVTDIGYGLERCLYDVNSALHCLSPTVRDSLVLNSGELLSALEDAGKNVDANVAPLDRHIAAFIASRFGGDTGKHLIACAEQDKSIATLGMLSLLALLQWRLGVPSLPNLTNWVGTRIEPVLEIYHGKTTRKELERELPRVIRKGSLPDLFSLLDDAERRDEDSIRYVNAVHTFAVAEEEIAKIENNASRPDEFMENGQMIAAIISIILALIISIVIFASGHL